MATQARDSVDRIFTLLKSKSEEKRYAAAVELHDLVVSTSRGIPDHLNFSEKNFLTLL